MKKQVNKSVFLDNYKPYGSYKPYKKQVVTVDFHLRYPRLFNFNEIGTGKTVCAVWAFDFLRKFNKVNKALVMAPLSTLEKVWVKDILNACPRLTYKVLYGSAAKRLELLKEDVDIYIINHDGIKVIHDELKARKDIDLVVLDEASLFRKHNTDKFKALYSLCEERHSWCMTGSPTPNAPTDIWPTARIICPNNIPKYFTQFRRRVMYQVSQYQWKANENWQEYMAKYIQPAIRITRDECFDLPPIIKTTRICKLSPEQTKIYKDLVKEFIAEYNAHTITAVNAAAKRTKLLQVVSGAVYDDEHVTTKIPCGDRMAVLEECVTESNNKAIVFVAFKNIQKAIRNSLIKNLNCSVEIINGDTPVHLRNTLFGDFQDNKLNVLIAHPKCTGYGLDLTASRTIIWWSPIDDCDVYMQANGRITRGTQTRSQLIIHLTASKLEDLIYERLEHKQSMQDVLLQLIKMPLTS